MSRENNNRASLDNSSTSSHGVLDGDPPFELHYGEYANTDGGKILPPNVSRVDPLDESKQFPGTLYITNYRLYFHPQDNNSYPVDIPLGSISRLEKVGYLNVKSDKYGIDVVCKDFFSVRFHLNRTAAKNNATSRHSIFDKLKALCFPLSYSTNGSDKKISIYNLFAYSYKKANPDFGENGWDVYNVMAEFERIGITRTNNDWQIIDQVNKDYTLCDSYPSVFAVPKSVTVDEIRSCAQYRSRGRIPVLSWIDSDGRASITRCSQPMAGIGVMGGKRCPQADQNFIKHLIIINGQTTSLCIVDARPRSNAVANRGKGGGFESNSDYLESDIELCFVDIQNIHVMRESYRKLNLLCWPKVENSRFLSQLESTQWLSHIRQMLLGALYIIHKVGCEKFSVMVHCSDGWDRTAQLVALAMLCLDPYYRTIRGFEVLIEKEWCCMGHKFAQRIGVGEDNPSDSDRSPVFLQFIECVWQVTRQFPNAFEFNELFLIVILKHLYSNLFGTFIYNTERERNEIRIKTHSLWTLINSQISEYQNPHYSTNVPKILKPQHSMPYLKFWSSYYLRHHLDCNLQEPLTDRILRQKTSEIGCAQELLNGSNHQSSNGNLSTVKL